MALQNCHECGKQVSTEADKCVHCGAPINKAIPERNAPEKKPGCLAIVGISIAILVFFIFLARIADKSSVSSSSPAVQEKPRLSPEEIQKQQEEERKKEEAFLKSKAGKIWLKNKHWSRDDCETIAEEKIRIGMTADQVRMAWGKPYRINSTQTASGTHEQWVMHDSMNPTYLYFVHGILRTIQQSR